MKARDQDQIEICVNTDCMKIIDDLSFKLHMNVGQNEHYLIWPSSSSLTFNIQLQGAPSLQYLSTLHNPDIPSFSGLFIHAHKQFHIWSLDSSVSATPSPISSRNHCLVYFYGLHRLSVVCFADGETWTTIPFVSFVFLRNHWTDLTKNYREQVLNVLCQVYVWFLGRSDNKDGHPSLWLAEKISTSLQSQGRIRRNLTGSKCLLSYAMLEVFYRADRKQRWLRWSQLECQFFPSTLQPLNEIWRNFIGSKYTCKIVHQVCVFQADLSNKMVYSSYWLR